MLAILNFLNAHNLPICKPILMILVSKFMVHRVLSDKTYLSLGLLSPLTLSTYKQIPTNILTKDENCHSTQHIKRIFWYLAVLIINS